MRLSVWPAHSRPYDEVLAVAQGAEEQGWDGLWFADHFLAHHPRDEKVDGPVLECFSALAALAAATERLRLGSLVAGNLYRHPAVLANVAATIDVISGGRFVLGLGAGWQQNEHDAYGIDLVPPGPRIDRLEEAAEVITSLLRADRTDFAGEHYRLDDAPLDPKPLGPLPLLIGGGGEQRTLRVAARFADEWNAWCTPEALAHKGEVLARHCAEVGRDPAAVERSTQAFLLMGSDPGLLRQAESAFAGRPTLLGSEGAVADQVAAYRDAGADELIVPDWNLGPPEQALDALSRFLGVARGA